MSKEMVEACSRFFGLCTILGFILLYSWFAIYALPGNTLCRLSLSLFEVTQHECAIINYSGMALVKALILLFFFFPWVVLRLELRKRK